jgi:hypothetical protein
VRASGIFDSHRPLHFSKLAAARKAKLLLEGNPAWPNRTAPSNFPRLFSYGRIYIVEMVIPDDNSPSLASLMDLNMMVMLPGRERALKEYKALLDASGLKFERVIPTHSPFEIIEASKK